MTDDDLWTEDQMKAVASRKYWDNFTDDKKEMANALNIDQQSDRAIKKYDPFKLDFSSFLFCRHLSANRRCRLSG